MELETDKAVVEVPSTVSGVVKEIRVKEGEKIKVGQVIFTFENGAGSVARAPSPAKVNPKHSRLLRQPRPQKASPVEPTATRHQHPSRESGAFQRRPPVRPNSNCPNSEKTSPRAISCAS